jgi:hypothetical protein
MTEMTYGRLDQILKSLGFSSRPLSTGGKAYLHPSEALLTFPPMPEGDEVIPIHRLAVRAVLDGFGIPLPAELAGPTQQAG